MGLDLVDQVDLVVEGDHAGVVVEHRDQPGAAVALPQPAVDLLGQAADVGGEQRADGLGRAVALAVGDRGVEDLVLAVLAPGLGQALELDVGGGAAEAGGAAARCRGGGAEVVADGGHLGERQRQQSLAADPLELVVVAREIDGAHRRPLARRHLGNRQVGRPPLPLGAALHADGLDDRVGDELEGDPLGRRPIDAGEQVEPRGVDRGAVAERPPEGVLDRHPGALADRIGDPGPVGDGDHLVEGAAAEPSDGALVEHRIGELGDDRGQLLRGELRLDVVDVAGAHLGHRDAQEVADLPRYVATARVRQLGPDGDLQAVDHRVAEGGARRAPAAAAAGRL